VANAFAVSSPTTPPVPILPKGKEKAKEKTHFPQNNKKGLKITSIIYTPFFFNAVATPSFLSVVDVLSAAPQSPPHPQC